MKGRFLIAGTNSGCGKTTVTTALLSALRARGIPLAAFKCGPDYIDPMFHRQALGLPSHNLDPYFSTGEQLRSQLAAAGEALCVIEGVMGYYDGIGTEGRASSYHAALATETPVILVVGGKGLYTSAGAVLKGFCEFRPNSNVRGVIFNGVSSMVYRGLAKIAEEAGVTPLGFLPRSEAFSVGSRHLGLITADEIGDLQNRLQKLGEAAAETLDLEAILRLAERAAPLPPPCPLPAPVARVRVAVARDRAFCFLYQENLELLEALGCELCFFSPLADAALPEGVSGLWLPGGYPELHLEALSRNSAMLRAVKTAVEGGLPTIAECGGFLYLHRQVDGVPLAGVIPADAHRTDRLQRFGYVELTAAADNLLCPAGGSIRAHEFHYYDSTDCGAAFTARKASGAAEYPCIHASDTLYAGYPHLYLPANRQFAEHFIRKAETYAASGNH